MPSRACEACASGVIERRNVIQPPWILPTPRAEYEALREPVQALRLELQHVRTRQAFGAPLWDKPTQPT
jgi:hypothetical protein